MMPTGTGGAGSSGSHARRRRAVVVRWWGRRRKPRLGSLQYDLYAVLLYMGSLEKGHYFALIKDVEDGAWHKFDDERVTRLEDAQFEAELKRAYGGKGSTSAYMLLYREVPNADAPRDGDRPTAGGSRDRRGRWRRRHRRSRERTGGRRGGSRSAALRPFEESM